jgi:hypothetical protein
MCVFFFINVKLREWKQLIFAGWGFAQQINRSHWMLIFKPEWWWKKNIGKYIYYWHAIDVNQQVRDKQRTKADLISNSSSCTKNIMTKQMIFLLFSHYKKRVEKKNLQFCTFLFSDPSNEPTQPDIRLKWAVPFSATYILCTISHAIIIMMNTHLH